MNDHSAPTPAPSEALLHLAVGAGFGLVLSLPLIRGALILVSIFFVGALWYPFLALPSLIHLWRRGNLRAGLVITLAATVAFTFAFIPRLANEVRGHEMLMLGAWDVLWLAAAAAPLLLRLARSTRSTPPP